MVAISFLLVGVPDVLAQASNPCPEGQIWSLNRCTDVEETTCQTGYTYVADNGCVQIEEEDAACPSGYVMEGGRCQREGQSCPVGETWRNGSCQTRDEESCPAGKERVNGSCFQITDTVCPVGHSWNDSKDRCEDNSPEDQSGNSNTNSVVVNWILTLSETTLTVDEGCNVTYTVAPKSEPSGDVTVTIGDPANTDVTAEPETLTFTVDNWDEPQTVTVTCAEDDDAVDDKATVTHTVDRPDRASVADRRLTIRVTDNDEAGVTLSESSFNVNEVCDETYTIQLDTEPSADVTVTIGDPANTAVTAEPTTLTFTPGDWDIPQTVTVSCAEDDNAVNEESIVTHRIRGGDYEGVSAPDVTFTVTDNDEAGLTLSESVLPIDEGGTATYTIQLDSEPTAKVKVTMVDPANAAVKAKPATLTFTPAKWDVPQTVTVTGVEDDNAVNEVSIVTHTVSGGDYEGIFAPDVAFNVTDNDEAGLTLSVSSFDVNEVCRETYTIQLDTEPTADVTVTIVDPANTAVTADPATLTYTPDDWDDPQTVTATCAEDDNAVNEESTVTHTVSGGDYAGVSVPDVTINVTDNDVRGLTFSETSFQVNEVCSETYTIQLDTQPTADVTVTNYLTSSHTAFTAAPATSTFTPANWYDPQTVTVMCAEDDNAFNEKFYVYHSFEGGDYRCVFGPRVEFEVTDNDIQGVTFSASALTIDEGGTGTFTVQVNAAPSSPNHYETVIIEDPADNRDVKAEPQYLTFTNQNWYVPQTVTVSAREDDDADDDQATVTHDPNGDSNEDVANVIVSVRDNDTRGVTLSESNVSIYEGGRGTYAVQLDTEPTGNVTVTINSPSDNTAVTAEPATLTFKPRNWDKPQTVTVNVGEDEDAVDGGASVTHTVSGADYADVSAAGVTLNIIDNDKAGVFIWPTFHAVDDDCDFFYTVTLLTVPTADVTVAVGGSSNPDVTADPPTLTFTPDNWDDEQYVDVFCTEDDDAVVGKTNLTHTVTGGDYDGFTAPDVAVTVRDRDVADVILSESNITVQEGGTGTYTVQLDTEPTDNVIVTVHDPTYTDVTADPATLTFTTQNWEDPQTVTISAVENDDDRIRTATVTHSISGGDYGSVNVDSVIVTVIEPVPTPLPTFDKDITDAFIAAIVADQGATVTQLLTDHGFPHYLDEGKSALFYALENDSPNAFDVLLAHADVDPNIANGHRYTPLFRAIEFGQSEYVRKLLDHADTDPNALSFEVHVAILHWPDDILKMLLDHPDTNPNLQAWDDQRTPLRMAVQYTATSAVELLLAHPDIDPSIEDIKGWTPLQWACFFGYRDDIVALLEAYEADN